jgi:hypothetical protein
MMAQKEAITKVRVRMLAGGSGGSGFRPTMATFDAPFSSDPFFAIGSKSAARRARASLRSGTAL